jgi:hypothetical protein
LSRFGRQLPLFLKGFFTFTGDENPELRLQNSFRQVALWAWLRWRASVLRTAIMRGNFTVFWLQQPQKAKGLYIFSLLKITSRPSFCFGLEVEKEQWITIAKENYIKF